MENLNVEFTENKDCLEVILKGQLTLMDALELKQTLPKKAALYSKTTIDLYEVSAIDLTGFNALLMTKKSINSKPLEIKADQNHPFFELAHLTKFTDQFVFSS